MRSKLDNYVFIHVISLLKYSKNYFERNLNEYNEGTDTKNKMIGFLYVLPGL